MPRKAKEEKPEKKEKKVDRKEVAPASIRDAAAAWVSKINKSPKYKGCVQVRMASDVQTPYHLRRPTGILSLDLALGGGFHAGGPAQISAAEGVGKTWLTFKTAAQVQKNYGDQAAVLIYYTEIRPDKGFARQAGFCVSYTDEEITEFDSMRMAQGLPTFTEEEIADLRMQIGTVVFLGAVAAEDGLNVIRDALRDRVFQLVIIDSLGALLSQAAEEGDVEDQHYAGSAKAITQFQNMTYPLYMLEDADHKLLETTILGTNQVRANIGASPHASKTRPAMGAYSWKHGQLSAIDLTRGGDIKDDPRGPVVGKDVNWKMVKGKAGTHDGKSGSFKFYHLNKQEPIFWKDVETSWLGGVDVLTDAVETAVNLGVIQQAGSWLSWTMPNGKELRAQGADNLTKLIEEDAEANLTTLRDMCFKEAGILARYT